MQIFLHISLPIPRRTGNAAAQTLSFTTTGWQRMTLTVQPEGKYIAPGQEIVLTCSEEDADIYYSTDGREPSNSYTGPLTFSTDMTLRAVARLDGYYDCDLQHEYIKTVEIVERFPDEEPLYVYKDVVPSITYSDGIQEGSAFSRITIMKNGEETVGYGPFIQGKTLFLVPNEPLELGCVYTVTMPEGALVTEKGEDSQALTWPFKTGFFATAVSTGGPELMAALMTDRSLWTWGRRLTEANAEDGSYSYDAVTAPATFASGDVIAVSSGYMHHALLKHDDSLWMWGRQLCGEFGNGSTTASAQPMKIMDGVRLVSCGLQTTAIVKQDGTLWMCGRNDLGQIDDTRTVRSEFVKIADAVNRVALNWGSIDIEKTDGTTETRTWDADADSQRQPSPVSIDDMVDVAYGWKNALALRQDGSVWTWGEGAPLSEIIAGRNPQPLEGVRLLTTTLALQKGDRVPIPSRPVPLLADYELLGWNVGDESVVSVDGRGVVTALADGETDVTASISDAGGRRYEATCRVRVGDGSAIQTVADDTWQLRASVLHGALCVSDVPAGQTVGVFTVSGACVYRGSMPDSQLTIPNIGHGIYLVQAGRQTRKVIVR